MKNFDGSGRSSSGRRLFWGVVAVGLLTLGVAGCAAPGTFFSGSQDEPKRMETVADFVGAERPS